MMKVTLFLFCMGPDIMWQAQANKTEDGDHVECRKTILAEALLHQSNLS